MHATTYGVLQLNSSTQKFVELLQFGGDCFSDIKEVCFQGDGQAKLLGYISTCMCKTQSLRKTPFKKVENLHEMKGQKGYQ